MFDAIGKYVHPTRYRQIVETVSSRKLSSNVQDTISEDQEHSSVVARVHYQKQRSREIANKAQEYLETLYGEKGSALEMDVRSRLSDKSASSPEQAKRKMTMGQSPKNTTFSLCPLIPKARMFRKHPILLREGKFCYLLQKRINI